MSSGWNLHSFVTALMKLSAMVVFRIVSKKTNENVFLYIVCFFKISTKQSSRFLKKIRLRIPRMLAIRHFMFAQKIIRFKPYTPVEVLLSIEYIKYCVRFR